MSNQLTDPCKPIDRPTDRPAGLPADRPTEAVMSLDRPEGRRGSLCSASLKTTQFTMIHSAMLKYLQFGDVTQCTRRYDAVFARIHLAHLLVAHLCTPPLLASSARHTPAPPVCLPRLLASSLACSRPPAHHRLRLSPPSPPPSPPAVCLRQGDA